MENKILYITQSGKLSRKDNTLLFENEKIKKVIPIIWLEQIYCLSEISINSKLLSYLAENKIVVHFFNYYGYYTWSYYPRESYVSWKLLIEQVRHYENLNKRLIIAKNIVKWIWKNAIYMLYHYKRHWKNVDKYINSIKTLLNEVNFQKDIFQVLNVEWSIWSIFYESFQQFLPDIYHINKREKRPPLDPINALISFGNSVLYSFVLSKIYLTQLNPTISYLHEPFERRFSLALDLAEAFKFPLVYSVIFNLINRKILKIDKHFERNLNYTLLTNEWRKIFLKFWDKKIKETFLHPKLKRKVSYWTYIKLDAYKLIKHLIWEQEFIPFNMENKI